jgi:hypothetical protein
MIQFGAIIPFVTKKEKAAAIISQLTEKFKNLNNQWKCKPGRSAGDYTYGYIETHSIYWREEEDRPLLDQLKKECNADEEPVVKFLEPLPETNAGRKKFKDNINAFFDTPLFYGGPSSLDDRFEALG